MLDIYVFEVLNGFFYINFYISFMDLSKEYLIVDISILFVDL